MAEYEYDLFVIGAGSGGVRAARMSAIKGAKVMIAEEHRPGGTCVIRGCVPKKFMVYASGYRKQVKQARDYGWDLPEKPAFDWPRFRDAMNAEVDRLSGIYARNLKNTGVDLVEERAEIIGPHEVRLCASDRVVTAKHILIATGGVPSKDWDLPGVEHTISSNELFHLKKLPEHIVIAGGGYIACEFAQIFAGLGVKTCLVYRRDTVLRGFDEDVRTFVHEGLKASGVRVITHTVFEKIEPIEDREGWKKLTLANGDEIEADQIVFAIGRKPYTEGLGLENAGVEIDEIGAIKVDAYSKTSVDHIYAVGDVTNRVNLTPVAIREGAAFAETVFGGKPTAYDHDLIPSAVFTQPPVGTAGLTETEARHAYGGAVDVYKTKFRPMKGMITDSPDWMTIKLVVRQSDQVVLGVHMVGDDAPEIIQAVGIAVKAGLTKDQFDATCAVHPTVAEELVTLREKWVPPELAAAE
ncbi:MAG: glutathione-disulfide reductase [Oceanicaulis sp.]